MRIVPKLNVKTIIGSIVTTILILFSLQLIASKGNKKVVSSALTSFSDTIPVVAEKVIATSADSLAEKDSIHRKDSVIKTVDTLVSKDSLDAPVNYSAKDSGVLIMSTKQFVLYGKSNTKYKDITLDAATINYDQQSQLIRAYGMVDTSNNPMSKPKLVQAQMKSVSDSILFNMKSMKGITKNTHYMEGEMHVNAQELKKVSADVFYGRGALITTCNLDTPHFAIRTRRIKLINNKIAVSGPASPEFEGVPIPIGIPFGIFPLTQGRHSGLIAPAFASNDIMGFGLTNLGYYKVVNDNLDVTSMADIYSYGGWRLNVNPKYIKRYHYSGALNITIQKTVSLNNTPYNFTQNEFSKFSTFMLNWSHTRDNRARPGTNFSASVNFGSTRYNQLVPNAPILNINNNLNSNISYSKDFKGKANLSVNLNTSQNSVTRLVSLNLPNISFNMATVYPFQKKDKIGTPKWYESFGIGYSTNFQNQFSYYDTAFNFKKMLDTAQWTVTHTVPITFTLPQLGPVTFSPSIGYSEQWLAQKLNRYWDTSLKKVDTTLTKGIYALRNVSFGMSASTRVFGTLKFKNSFVKAIRHEMRPTIGFSYTPNLTLKNYQSVQVDTFGHKMYFSQLGLGASGTPILPKSSGSVTFGIDNLLEMKVKDKSDTSASATKKIKLIDGFGFNSAYDLLADSFAMAPVNFYMRSTLFEKINITTYATLDPYQVDNFGYHINKLMLADGKLGRITNANIAISTSFKSKPKDEKTDKQRLAPDPFLTPDEQMRQLQYARSNPAEFTDFNIPWDLSLSYALRYSKTVTSNLLGSYSYMTVITSSVNFSGSFSLTPKWKTGGNGYFDLTAGKLQLFTLWFSREMHCWQMNVNVTPVGPYRSFSITISPKSGILRDLRINRNRSYYSY